MARLLISLLSTTLCTSIASATDFDFLYFTQVWPQSACEKWKEASVKNTCNLRNGGNWSIHGIWPTTNNVIGPLYCNKTIHFDPAAIQGILSQLEANWIDVHGGPHDKYSFWKHEYLKHGTCAVSIKDLSTELLYFSKGLSLHKHYDISSLLNEGGVYEGNSYNSDAFINALSKSLGVFSPALECDKDKDGHFLYQIGICFTKDFELMNCDQVAGGPYGNCPRDTNSLIRYPYGPNNSGFNIGLVFIIILSLAIVAGLVYYLYTKYANHRRLSEYNSL
uniref:Ribonuclease Oy n=1 Tax=Caligus clemensi TaxID=344056 RepID=C1C2B8_CALCM|nr:Ribonuclease Oy [Caligus clemensi]